jgi:hypothetical protein
MDEYHIFFMHDHVYFIAFYVMMTKFGTKTSSQSFNFLNMHHLSIMNDIQEKSQVEIITLSPMKKHIMNMFYCSWLLTNVIKHVCFNQKSISSMTINQSCLYWFKISRFAYDSFLEIWKTKCMVDLLMLNVAFLINDFQFCYE